MNIREIFDTTIAFIGGYLTFLLGGWDICLKVLVMFIALDYMTGVAGAFMQRKVSSYTGRKGIIKKATILVVLIMAVLLDRLLNNGTWVFRTLVCYFYIANEGISLLENAVNREGVTYFLGPFQSIPDTKPVAEAVKTTQDTKPTTSVGGLKQTISTNNSNSITKSIKRKNGCFCLSPRKGMLVNSYLVLDIDPPAIELI